MAVLGREKRETPRVIDRATAIQQAREIDERAGIIPEPGLTAEMLQNRIAAKLRVRGIDPEMLRYSQDDKD